MIKNIIFDIGDVLCDYRWRDFLRDKGIDGDLLERVAKATTKSAFWPELDRGVLSDEELLDGLVKNDPEIEKEIRLGFSNFRNICVMRDYAIPWVKELKARGYNVYYLSNYTRKNLIDGPDSVEFTKYMDGGVYSCYAHAVKPERKIYECLLEKYSLKAEECLFIDDSPKNIDAARELGFNVILFESRGQVLKDMKERFGI